MKDWQSQAHVKWECKYHVVIVGFCKSMAKRNGVFAVKNHGQRCEGRATSTKRTSTWSTSMAVRALTSLLGRNGIFVVMLGYFRLWATLRAATWADTVETLLLERAWLGFPEPGYALLGRPA